MKLKFANALSLALIMAMLFTSIGLADVATGQSISINSGATDTNALSVTVGVNALHCPPGGDMAALEVAFRNSASDPWTVVHAASTPWPGPDADGCNAGVAAPASFVWTLASGSGGSRTVYASFKHGSDIVYADDSINFVLSSNTPPSISVTDVTEGASYSKGSVPAAGCSVTDSEDGNSSFLATLSEITGPYASDGIGSQTASCSYTDAGGLNATASATYSIVDPSAPSINYTLNPASPDGNNGWYKSNVTLTWNVSEPESPSSLVKTGCVDQNITSDQGATIYSCSASSAGGAAAQVDVTIMRDATPPTISGSAAPAANGAGWNNTDVTVTFTCSDSLSGVASCGPDSTAAAEGAALSVPGTAVDNAGNSAGTTVSPINIDKTAPTISGSAAPAANGAGWNNTDVTVSFTCGDSLSGVASCEPAQTLSSEGAGQSVTGNAWDNADNSNTATVGPINIDKTAPTISGSAAPAANGAGWNNTDVTVTFTCGDSLSGVATCGPNQTLSSDGADQSATGNASDNAENGASATVGGINIDKTPPVVAVTGVTNGTTYTLGSVPAAGCSTTDALSGVATNATLSLSGGLVGSVTATCSGAEDFAGNSGSASVTYNVIYNWTGFFQPVDNYAVNTAKAGSAIPVKFSLGGNQGLGIFATGYPKFVKTSCTTGLPEDTIETTVTAGGSSLTYDALAGQYIYVWKTDKAWVGWCGQLQVTLIDGTKHTASFKLK